VKVLVDTPIWSLALRRWHTAHAPEVIELAGLIQEGLAAMIGPVRQEVLSGIRLRAHYEALRDHLRAFVDTEISADDYEEAASFFNRCRAKGVQGSNTDFLICAVAVRNDSSIFTTDRDFTHFAKQLPIKLHRANR